ncbi:hypothetical protein [Paenibacillus camelliae]|uniref:hypothetical protein n=1 Tax=Paenibacillus camelliae TaxID=512410 RepID=UPI00203FD970|nr:hypothetical protein [Paenibacillus camelliae]MCM3632950.1 hypothetical protein [Paenibacillus camelliae]
MNVRKKSEWIQKYGLFILVLVVWISYIFIMRFFFKSDTDKNSAGTFGDMFGALNTLFTGLAFVGVVISLLQQNKALEQQNKSLIKQQQALDQQKTVLEQQQEALNIQKNELELYKNELHKNNIQLTEHSVHMRLQRIENTIFNLLDAHAKDIENIYSKHQDYIKLKGYELLEEILDKLISTNRVKNVNSYRDSDNYPEYVYLGNVQGAYGKFRYIIKYIDQLEDVTYNQKQDFMRMVDAQLSTSVSSLYLYKIYFHSDDETYGEILKKYKII